MVIRILSIILYAFFTLECFSSNYPFRTWTSKTGVKIEARFIETSGDQLTIERSDSKKFVFPLALLSNEDQIYVRGTLKSLSQTPLSSSEALPIWSPAIISNWWQENAQNDWSKASDRLIENLRDIWVNKEKKICKRRS